MLQLICTLSFDPADEENDWAENSLLSIRNNVSASGTSFAVEKKEKKEKKKNGQEKYIFNFDVFLLGCLFTIPGGGGGAEHCFHKLSMISREFTQSLRQIARCFTCI